MYCLRRTEDGGLMAFAKALCGYPGYNNSHIRVHRGFLRSGFKGI